MMLGSWRYCRGVDMPAAPGGSTACATVLEVVLALGMCAMMHHTACPPCQQPIQCIAILRQGTACPLPVAVANCTVANAWHNMLTQRLRHALQDDRGVSRDEMAIALMEVAEGRLPRDRIALKCVWEDITAWPFLAVDTPNGSSSSDSKASAASVYEELNDGEWYGWHAGAGCCCLALAATGAGHLVPTMQPSRCMWQWPFACSCSAAHAVLLASISMPACQHATMIAWH